MKRSLFTSALFFAIYFSFGQVPNAGMEYWNNEPVLLQWETNSRPLTLPPWDPYVVKQDTDRYSGNLAANLYANGIFKAYATATFPISFHPQNLSLYYKTVFAPCVNNNGFPDQDTVSVLVEILSSGAVVDQGYWESTASSFSYSQLIIPVSQNATVFDSCRITMMGGRVIGGCGFMPQATEFKVDHLELKYSNEANCIDSALVCSSCNCPTVYDPVCGCDGITYSNSCTAYYAGVTSWVTGVCGSQTGCIDSLQICDTCACPLIYSPVCGCNGVTYDNSCFAQNAGVSTWTQGRCGTSPCKADFYYSGSFIAPATIQYQDFSQGTNITNWEWTFSDGSVSNQQNPSVTYTTPGIYTACLKITSADTSGIICEDSICQTVIITDSSGSCINPSQVCDTCTCPLIFDPVCGCDGITYDNSCFAQIAGVISWLPGQCGIISPCEAYYYYWSDTNGYIVNFEYASGWIPNPANNSQLLLWDFGDGTTSTDEHPVRTYTDTSIHSYFVCLTVTDTSLNCTNMYCDSVYVGRTVYGCYAGFGYTIDTNGVVVVYVDSSSGVSSGGTWVLGDSTTVETNPSFELDSTNNYDVCFVVMNDSMQCTDTVCVNTLELYAEYRAMVGIQPVSQGLKQVYLYPNPASANSELRFTTTQNSWVDISVKNLLGEVVYQITPAKLNAGSYFYQLKVESLSKGIYLVEIKLNGSVAAVKKLSRQ